MSSKPFTWLLPGYAKEGKDRSTKPQPPVCVPKGVMPALLQQQL